MDPFAALGVVSNVISLVDFSGKLIKICRSGYLAATHSSQELDDVQFLTAGLEHSLQRLSFQQNQPVVSDSISLQDGNEVTLHKVASECSKIAQELLRLVETFRTTDPNSRRGKAKAMIQYIKSRGDYAEMASRLEQYQRQLELNIILSIRHAVLNQVPSSAIFPQRFDQHEREVIEGMRRGEHHISQLMSRIDFLHGDITQRITEDGEKTRRAFADTFNSQRAASQDDVWKNFHSHLGYPGWDRRINDVALTHENTAQWLLSDPPEGEDWPSLVLWLAGEDTREFYWIAGKPGAGKSTAMKMIATRNETQSLLDSWASRSHRDSSLTAHHFFSSQAADDLAKSITGMLRSILYQLLRFMPEQCELVFAAAARPQPENVKFYEGDLISWLEQLFSRVKEHVAMCLVIDGLDECKDDHDHLNGILKRLVRAGGGSVRILAASRPWGVFANAFEFSNQGRQARTLHLHKHTASDIQRYAFDKLHEMQTFQRLSKRWPEEAERVVSEITTKANGVFAWVQLAVHRMRQLLSWGKMDVQRLLAEARKLPTELHDLYDQTISRIHEDLRAECACLLLLWRIADAVNLNITDYAAFDRVFYASYWFLLSQSTNIKIWSSVGPFGNLRDDFTAEYIQSITGGIFQPTVTRFKQEGKAGRLTIKPLHLTVREWLAKDKTVLMLESWIPGGLHSVADALVASMVNDIHHQAVDGKPKSFKKNLEELLWSIPLVYRFLNVVTSDKFDALSETTRKVFGTGVAYSSLEHCEGFYYAAWEGCLETEMMALEYCGRSHFGIRPWILGHHPSLLTKLLPAPTTEEVSIALVVCMSNSSLSVEANELLDTPDVNPNFFVPDTGCSPWTCWLLFLYEDYMMKRHGRGYTDAIAYHVTSELVRKGATPIEQTQLPSRKSKSSFSAPKANEYLYPQVLRWLAERGFYDGEICSDESWIARAIENEWELPWSWVHRSEDLNRYESCNWASVRRLYQVYKSPPPRELMDRNGWTRVGEDMGIGGNVQRRA